MNRKLFYITIISLMFIGAGCAQKQPAAEPYVPPTSAPTPAPTTPEQPVTPQIPSEQPAAQQAPSEQTVTIANFAFTPASLTVTAGTTVTWVNNDSVPHKIVADDSSNLPGLSSENLSQGDSYSFTFSTPGTFNYYCQIHPSMKGTVVVSQ